MLPFIFLKEQVLIAVPYFERPIASVTFLKDEVKCLSMEFKDFKQPQTSFPVSPANTPPYVSFG